MDKKLIDILNGNEENYILPFYWQRGDHTDSIPQQMQMIFDSGCGAVCIESRPHPDFCGEKWWRDMDIILQEAKKLGMKVWLLDDDRFPTGHAAGWIEKKYPELRQWELVENHIDVAGPMKDGAIILEKESEEHIFLGAYAYKRNYDEEQTCTTEMIDLNDCVDLINGYINIDVPEGVWRVFSYYKSRRGSNQSYIDTINPKSVRVLIDAVYETHYERYKEYFGNTLVGFFSDEPQFGNMFYKFPGVDKGVYEARIGSHNLAYPWNETVCEMMEKALGYSPIPYLNLLWFEDDEDGDRQSEIRFAYMDAITNLYSSCFTGQIAAWAQEHGVMYIGHVIEDMNCHLRAGAGHFYRALSKQHMSGMDLVLHQVLPGMEHLTHTAEGANGTYAGEFFHYTLGKMCASLAHLTPHMKGRAMCEIFGAYGYGEDSVIMKYLIDFLLVRGVNRFVPHAFSTRYPDGDCPPHFGVCGKDPSFEAFSALMKYTNKASHLLSDAKHIANVALLYHMDNLWASRFENAMTCEPAAVKMFDEHIDFDIVSADMLENAEVCEGKLHIADESFKCLVVPYADHISKKVAFVLQKLAGEGLKILFIDDMPDNFNKKANINLDNNIYSISLENLIEELKKIETTDVIVDGDYPLLRIYHCMRNKTDIFMFVNEDISKAVKTNLILPVQGDYMRIDILNDIKVKGNNIDSVFLLELQPYQSQIVIFDEALDMFLDEAEYKIVREEDISPKYTLELAEFNNMAEFKNVGDFEEFFNITAPTFRPDFAGKMRYSFNILLNDVGKHVFLDLGTVGQNAMLNVNGKEIGIRIAKPYIFDITSAIKNGTNDVCVTVSNTLVRNTPDVFSKQLLLAPSGLLGGMKIKYTK